MLKVTLLMDDQKNDELLSEHGFSVFLETENEKILFDTGQSSNFIKNSKKLNIKLGDLDAVVLSHGHYDHVNGLSFLLDEYYIKRLFVGENFFKKKYKELPNGELLYRGANFTSESLKNIKINYIKADKTEIFKDVFIIKNFKRLTEFEKDNPIFKVKETDGFKIDNFSDEISLVIKVEGKLNVFIGCAHPGVINMLLFISSLFEEKIGMVYGGIHLKDSSQFKIEKTLDYLHNLNIPFYHLLHCTGSTATKKIARKGIINNRNIKVGETIYL